MPSLSSPSLALTGIGHAIVDILAYVDDDFLAEHRLTKGAMTLADAETAAMLYNAMPPGTECSGGSAGNTVAGVAMLGGKAAFIGKTGEDALGRIFHHDMEALGVTLAAPDLPPGAATAHCLILVTPDAERTMVTHLSEAGLLQPEDVDTEIIRDSAVTYIEGYLWDDDGTKAALDHAVRAAKDAGRLAALSLSDPFCVARHRESFLELIRSGVGLVFANEEEARMLTGAESLEEALEGLRALCPLAAVTRGADGAVVVDGARTWDAPAKAAGEVIDTTGAGDLFAAGFLHGLTRGAAPDACARLGCAAAGIVITQLGGRPQQGLAL